MGVRTVGVPAVGPVHVLVRLIELRRRRGDLLLGRRAHLCTSTE